MTYKYNFAFQRGTRIDFFRSEEDFIKFARSKLPDSIGDDLETSDDAVAELRGQLITRQMPIHEVFDTLNEENISDARLYDFLPSWCVFDTQDAAVLFVYRFLDDMWCHAFPYADNDGDDDTIELASTLEAVRFGRADVCDLRASDDDFGPYRSKDEMRAAFHSLFTQSPNIRVEQNDSNDLAWPSLDCARKMGGTLTFLGRAMDADDYPWRISS